MEPVPPARHHHPLRARLAAIAALALLVLAALAFLLVAINVVDALIVLGCLFLGTYCAWLSLTRPGTLLFLTIPGVLVALTILVLTRRVDLAAVNGRVFLNNASLGLYASVAQSATYREAKLRTWQRMLPDLLGGRTPVSELRFDLPDAGPQTGARLHMVSNSPYDRQRPRVAGSRPRLDVARWASCRRACRTPRKSPGLSR